MADSDLGLPSEQLVARPTNAFALRNGESIGVAQFIHDIVACSQSLPDNRYLADLSEDRYQFTVRFFAALRRAKVNLLPSQRDADGLRVLRGAYADTAVLDSLTASPSTASRADRHHRPLPAIMKPDRPAAIAFTSGTTGEAEAHPKTWAMLAAFRHVHCRYLSKWLRERNAATDEIGLVTTVPPWHMYGLEWTVLLPTIAPITLHCGNAFYPKDVTAALDRFESPTVLVTTPTHLRALLKSPSPQKPITLTLCATAPLDPVLTERVERHLETRIIDLYGCSEVGSLATRHPVDAPAWSFFDCFDLELEDDRLTVNMPLLPHPVTLADTFVRVGSRQFRLEGRATDIVKIGGKRESLANLNNLLLAMKGVDDGLVYRPESFGLPATGRLAAVVVAPSLDASSIRTGLAKHVDPVFIPRTIRFVESLPRQKSSKLPARALRGLVAPG